MSSNQPNVVITTDAIIGTWRVKRNLIVARVDGVNMLVSSEEFDRLIKAGHDVEARGESCETA
jgi:hypothetical protein